MEKPVNCPLCAGELKRKYPNYVCSNCGHTLTENGDIEQANKLAAFRRVFKFLMFVSVICVVAAFSVICGSGLLLHRDGFKLSYALNVIISFVSIPLNMHSLKVNMWRLNNYGKDNS